jgi:hypothetical protein
LAALAENGEVLGEFRRTYKKVDDSRLAELLWAMAAFGEYR